jgi:hypothetical protein
MASNPIDALSPERGLMSGLSTRLSGIPGINQGDLGSAYTQATTGKKPSLDPLVQQSINIMGHKSELDQGIAEGEQILSQAKNKMEHAQKQREAAEFGRLSDEFSAVEKTAPELHPTKDNVQSLAGIFSLIGVIGTAMGGQGRMSAMNAIKSMTGMMKGWQQGRMDLFAQEVKEFDAHVNEFKNRLDTAYKKYNMGLQKLATDREGAKADMDEALAELGSPLLKAKRDRQGYEEAGKTLGELMKSAQHVITEAGQDRRAQMPAKTAPMYKQTEITMKDGSKVPAVFEEHTGRYVGLDGKPVDISQIRSIVDVGTGSASRGGASNQRFAFNMTSSFGQLKNDLVGITKLKGGTTLSTFGELAGQSGDTLLKSLESRMGRALTTPEQQEFGKLVASFDARMATLLGGGYAGSTAKGLRDAYLAQVAKEGESPRVQALFLARSRQEMEEWANNFDAYPGATDEMKAKIQQNLDLVRKAIPWTVDDVLRIGVKPGEKTISQKFSQALTTTPQADISPLPTFANAEQAKAARDAGEIRNGDPIIVNGVEGNWHD